MFQLKLMPTAVKIDKNSKETFLNNCVCLFGFLKHWFVSMPFLVCLNIGQIYAMHSY